MRSRAAAAAAAVIGGAAAAYLLVVRPWQLRWGATDEERDATLDGDDLIANPDLMAIRAITVHAAAAQVWPWIAQLGQGRGGFYSYDALENLVGCDLHSADRIVPQWQDLKVGDQVKLHPEVGLGVTVVEQGRALVLRGGVPMGAVPCRAGCGGRLRDVATDAPRDQGSRRTRWPPDGVNRPRIELVNSRGSLAAGLHSPPRSASTARSSTDTGQPQPCDQRIMISSQPFVGWRSVPSSQVRFGVSLGWYCPVMPRRPW